MRLIAYLQIDICDLIVENQPTGMALQEIPILSIEATMAINVASYTRFIYSITRAVFWLVFQNTPSVKKEWPRAKKALLKKMKNQNGQPRPPAFDRIKG